MSRNKDYTEYDMYADYYDEEEPEPKYTKIEDRLYLKDRSEGYCQNKQHKGYLSVQQIKEHQCLIKQCPYLSKYSDREFWVRRRLIKLAKKGNKDLAKCLVLIDGRPFETDRIDDMVKYYMQIDTEDRDPELEFIRQNDYFKRQLLKINGSNIVK